MLDRALDAFLTGNTRWCEAVFAGVSATHASAAKLSGGYPDSSPTQTHHRGGPASAPTTRGSNIISSSNSRGGGEATAPSSNKSDGNSSRHAGGRSSTANGNSSGEDGGVVVGGIAAMSAVVKSALLCVRSNSSSPSSSSGPASSPGGSDANGSSGSGGGSGGRGGGGRGHEGEDPLAAALCLRLFRRVLQAGGADARAIAASVGVPTEGAKRRGEEAAAKVRREPSMQDAGGDGSGQEGPHRDDGGPVAMGRSCEDGEGGGGEASEGGVNGGGRGRVRCGPPLVPALEVAVRLLADGYSVAVMLQVRFCCFVWRPW